MEPEEAKLEPELEPPNPIDSADLCDCNPEFAVICSFIKQFGDKIDLELDIETLKRGLENQESLDDELIEIHVKLLKKLRRYFVRDQWEKALIRYAYEYSYEHGREIETQGYLKTRPSIKLQLLRRLLDAQFECDQKFKAAVNIDEATKLRNQPLGRDIKGNIYWHCDDKEGHLRVYAEEPLDHRSWKLVCKNIDELDNLIDELDRTKDDKIRGEPQTEPYNPYPEIYPEYFIKTVEDPIDINEEIKTSSRKYIKKGRRGRVMKKTSSESAAQVVNDIKTDTSIKLETLPDHHVSDDKVKTPSELYSDQSSQANSIESQVKQTLDSLISKVATSFDFFFRWNNTDREKKEAEPSTKPRKRNSRREKVVEDLPRRSSSRIQELQQRKITEYVEKQASLPKVPVAEVKVSKPIREEPKSNDAFQKPKKAAKKNKQRWRTKGKKKLSWDKDDSDLSSTSSLTDSNDESFVEELNGALNPETTHDSDEFACEEEDADNAPVFIKRVRTARQIVETEKDGLNNNNSIIEEDKPCGRCDKSNDPDWILLCDMCDDGYHTACCIPPLMFVPDGDWFCLPCEHKTLLSKLRDIAVSIKELLADKERERLKRQRLRQAFKKTTIKPVIDEIVTVEQNGTKGTNLGSTNAEKELDEFLGESPTQELSDSYKEGVYKRPKKKKAKQKRIKRRQRDFIDDGDDDDDEYDYSFNRSSRKTYSRRHLSETESEEDLPSSEISDDGSQPKTRKARACVSYRFQEYDELIQSAIRADSDEPVSENEDSPEPEGVVPSYGRGKDMATIEALAYQQENELNHHPMEVEPTIGGPEESVKVVKPRRKGRRLNDLDAESEIDIATSDDSFQAATETEEEEEEDEVTEIDSEDDSSIDEIVQVKYSRSSSRGTRKKKRNRYESDETDESDESDDYEPRTRRRASKKVSYKESTDEEDEDFFPATHPPFYKEDEVRSPNSTNNNLFS